MAGATLNEIAQAEGVNHSTISRRLSTDELKEYIETARANLISESIPKALENIKHGIEAYQDENTSTQLKEHGYKSSIRLAEEANILTPSNKNEGISSHTTITHAVQTIINNYANGLVIEHTPDTPGECIDVTAA